MLVFNIAMDNHKFSICKLSKRLDLKNSYYVSLQKCSCCCTSHPTSWWWTLTRLHRQETIKEQTVGGLSGDVAHLGKLQSVKGTGQFLKLQSLKVNSGFHRASQLYFYYIHLYPINAYCLTMYNHPFCPRRITFGQYERWRKEVTQLRHENCLPWDFY